MKSFGQKSWMLPQLVLIIGTYDKNGKPNAMPEISTPYMAKKTFFLVAIFFFQLFARYFK